MTPSLPPSDEPIFSPTRKRRGRGGDGVPEVFVADEQNDEPVDVARWGRLAEQVLEAEGIRGAAELSLLFVDETAITDLNERWLENEGSTDVLAFPIDDDLVEVGRTPDSGTTGPDRSPPEPGEGPVMLGDVVICPAVAARNAPDHAGNYDDEIALLVVHGILHVLGMDHADEEETAVMQQRERELLERFHRR
jgi:probable rRNA maturation factor